MPPADALPAAILGATGYVAGEILRLLSGHPRLTLAAAVSGSRVGDPLAAVFPHLRGIFTDEDGEGVLGDVVFAGDRVLDEILAAGSSLAVFSCLPHGHAAPRIDALLSLAEDHGTAVRVVDVSADFRLSPADHERVYGGAHGAPGRRGEFFCGLPELAAEIPAGHVAHPGCFATAVTLACAPAQALGLSAPHYRVSAVTGSTGSGSTPSEGTHHPERHGDFRAYKPLGHRHVAEVEMLLARLGGEPPVVSFAPSSGPFARGIYATVHLDLVRAMTAGDLAAAYAEFYARSSFVSVAAEPPRLKEVVGTNRCRIGVAADGARAVVFSAIDNLTKGAAGGAVQWMNRLCGWDETLGLRLPGLGWN